LKRKANNCTKLSVGSNVEYGNRCGGSKRGFPKFSPGRKKKQSCLKRGGLVVCKKKKFSRPLEEKKKKVFANGSVPLGKEGGGIRIGIFHGLYHP